MVVGDFFAEFVLHRGLEEHHEAFDLDEFAVIYVLDGPAKDEAQQL